MRETEPTPSQPEPRALYAGLFLLTLSTLLLEILTARLLSVVTWYHVSFFAVSLAMLGMAGGAVTVFAFGERFRSPAAARRSLAHATLAFALCIPVCHLASLALPMPLLTTLGAAEFLRAAATVVFLTAPFYLSGIAVTVALTRTGLAIGRLYAADLFGAAAGCVLVIPLLGATNVTAAVLVAALLAAAGALAARRFAGMELGGAPTATAIGLAAATLVAASGVGGVGIVPGKGVEFDRREVLDSAWNTHSNVVALQTDTGIFYWAAGKGADLEAEQILVHLLIDGGAATYVTRWNGERESLDWVRYDVTYLPYHLRHGPAGVIGVGGGRDVLSALAGGSPSVTGIEVNGILVEWLRGTLGEFAGLAGRDDVTLIHDEARAYLARHTQQYSVLQMSLIDTWAATGAGAFALSENGLYTLEAWRLFLDRLLPHGVLSVSRWFDPSRLSETNRLLALGTAALVDRGVETPADHLILVTRHNVATMLTSPDPFTATDLRTLHEVCDRLGFDVLVAPDTPASVSAMRSILASRSVAEVASAGADPILDFRPPTDDRPYFFNMLRPAGLTQVSLEGEPGGVVAGNIHATRTLVALAAVACVGVALLVLGPLFALGLPGLPRGRFALALVYFGGIGSAYMFTQFALLQRFSIYLGHPTYSLSVVLFTMILFTGLGSLLSDRLDLRDSRLAFVAPLLASAGIALLLIGLPPTLEGSTAWALPGRALVAAATTAPVAILLGVCFPVGLRVVTETAPDAGPWMWGVNGAFGVLGSIGALAISMWAGIPVTFAVAAGIYSVVGVALLWLRYRR